ncbi:MAG TPA: AEC family transporter [Gammaproteobacteria bacterium]|nr:AEC family transporter [Gammaproteobacteria bacterium]
MLLTILNIVFPVFAVIGVGTVWGKLHRPDLALVNRLNMEIFVPALVFAVLAGKDFQIAAYQQLALGAVAVVVGSGLISWPLAKLLKVDPKTFVPPMMFNNTGNMGIPLLLLAFGQAALPAAVLVFVIEMLLHFTLGLYILDHRTRMIGLLKIPIVQAAFAGLLFSFTGWSLPQAVAVPIEMLGQISIPLMLFALGVRLLDVDLSDLKLGIVGAIVCPVAGMAVAFAVSPWLTLTNDQWGILLVFAALPPAVLNFMVAEQYRQEPRQVASIVLIGNLGSLVFIPLALWWALR